jgi:hypothetical protein
MTTGEPSAHPRAASLPRTEHAWWLVAAIMAAILAVRGLLAWGVPAPLIFPDELVYTKLARSIWETGTTQFRGQPLNFPTLLYPLLLVPAEGVASAQVAFRIIQAINVVLITSAFLPVYLLGRQFLPWRASLLIAALSQALASTLYADFAMTESLFFPVLLWAGFFSVKAAEARGMRWKVGMGLVFAIGFFTKPHGMAAMPVVLVCLAFGQALRDGWQAAGRFPGPAATLRGMASYWPAFALLAGAVALQAARSALAGGGGGIDAAAAFGS